MRLALRLAREVARLPELEGYDAVRAKADVERAWRNAQRRFRLDRAERAYPRMSPEMQAALDEVREFIRAHRSDPS